MSMCLYDKCMYKSMYLCICKNRTNSKIYLKLNAENLCPQKVIIHSLENATSSFESYLRLYYLLLSFLTFPFVVHWYVASNFEMTVILAVCIRLFQVTAATSMFLTESIVANFCQISAFLSFGSEVRKWIEHMEI